MAEALWFSVVLGAGFGVLYGVISYINYRMALKVSRRLFMPLTVGGLLGRMLLCLGGITVVLVFTDVNRKAFLASFMVTFVIGLGLEVILLHRRVRALAAEAPTARPAAQPLNEQGENKSL